MYKRILIVVDERAASRHAVREGSALARVHGAEAILFSVLPRYTVPVADMPPFVAVSPQEFQQVAKANAEKSLIAASAIAHKAGVVSHMAMGSGDDDARCIVEAVRKRRCDMVVVASEGRNALLRLLTGSVIPGLITLSPVPVLVCREPPRKRVGGRAHVVPPKLRAAARHARAAPLAR